MSRRVLLREQRPVRRAAHRAGLRRHQWGFTEAYGGVAELTPAGVAVAVRLAEDLGVTVLALPDPSTATAAEIVELVGRVEPEQWRANAAAWVGHRGVGRAARELVAALGEPDRMLASGMDSLTVTLELGGPEELVAVFSTHDRDAQLALLEQLWRVERPGTAPVLEAGRRAPSGPRRGQDGPQEPAAPPQPRREQPLSGSAAPDVPARS